MLELAALDQAAAEAGCLDLGSGEAGGLHTEAGL
jgi:hypothetical protein